MTWVCASSASSSCANNPIILRPVQRAGIGHGFYYSLDRNVYLNVQDRVVQNTTVLPGQVKV